MRLGGGRQGCRGTRPRQGSKSVRQQAIGGALGSRRAGAAVRDRRGLCNTQTGPKRSKVKPKSRSNSQRLPVGGQMCSDSSRFQKRWLVGPARQPMQGSRPKSTSGAQKTPTLSPPLDTGHLTLDHLANHFNISSYLFNPTLLLCTPSFQRFIARISPFAAVPVVH